MVQLSEIIEVICEDFEGDTVDNGMVTEIISNTELIVNLLSDTTLYCKVELDMINRWVITEDIEMPIDINCRF